MPLSDLERAILGVDGWLSQEEAAALYTAAVQAPPEAGACTAVEIGSWKGRSTIALALAVRDRSGQGRVWAVDHHTGSSEHRTAGPVWTLPDFRNNIARAGVEPWVEALVMTSRQARARFAPGDVHLLWIDGAHEYEAVCEDLDLWLPTLAPGAVCAFDDCTWPPVSRALDERGVVPGGAFTEFRTVGKVLLCRCGRT